MDERKRTTRHTDLVIYKRAFAAGCRVFEETRTFPKEETYSLTDQVRRSARAVAANLSEAWRHRQYPAAFCSKLCVCEGEAAETQTWLQFAVHHGYLPAETARELYREFDEIIAMLVAMGRSPEKWCFPKNS